MVPSSDVSWFLGPHPNIVICIPYTMVIIVINQLNANYGAPSCTAGHHLVTCQLSAVWPAIWSCEALREAFVTMWVGAPRGDYLQVTVGRSISTAGIVPDPFALGDKNHARFFYEDMAAEPPRWMWFWQRSRSCDLRWLAFDDVVFTCYFCLKIGGL